MLNRSIYKHSASILILPLTFLAILSGIILSAPFASADSSTKVNVSVTVPATCSLTANPDSLSNAIAPGNSVLIGTSTVKAVCNDSAGLAVYAVGYTNDMYGNNKLVNTAGGSNLEIRSYVTASGTPPQSEWYMTINAVSGTYAPTIVSTFNNIANIIPTEYTKVAYRNTMTDMGTNANGARFTAAFNAYVTEDQAAGTYNGKVKFLLVHPNTNIIAPETFYTMQNVAEWGHNVDLGETVYAVDERDGEKYTVARLADGNLWMTKNLRLNIETANITAQNTNNPSAAFLTVISSKPTSSDNWCNDRYDSTCVDHVYYNTDNLGDHTVDTDNHTYDEYGVYYNWYTATAGHGTYDTVENINVAGDICPSGWRLPTGTTNNAGAPWDWRGDFWGLTAGLNGLTLDELTSQNYSPLMSPDSVALIESAPNNFLRAGWYDAYDNSIRERGATGAGHYWTSMKESQGSNYAKNLHYTSTYYTAGYPGLPETNGTPVRCVVNTHYLQDVADWGSNVALGETFEAIDRRDGQTYKVKRLKMNAAGTETALWMSNLNLGAESLTVTQLDNTNTHLASGVSAIPASTFNTWIKSSGTGSYTNPELIPLKSSSNCTVFDSNWNPSTVSCPEQDSYGNKYGTLYNYAAASAGTYTYASEAGTGDATSDLCPSGWRLPTGGTAGELQALIGSYNLGGINDSQWSTGGFTSIQQTLGFSLAGNFYNSTCYQGANGYYWSSIDSNYYGMAMYSLDFSESSIYPATEYESRGYGFSVRCIAQ